MRTAALILAVLLASACAKSGSAWIEIRNMTGQPLRDISLDYGRGALTNSFVRPRQTYGDWVRVVNATPLVITYTESSGGRRIPLIKALEADMIGGVMLVTIWPDGLVEQNVAPWGGSGPTGQTWLDRNYPWVAAALIMMVIPALIPLLLAAVPAGVPARSRPEKKLARSFPALERAATRLGMTRKACPVLYDPDSEKPIVWWQGKADGRMIGFLDGGMIWVGESGDETLGVFERSAPGGPFVARDPTVREIGAPGRKSPVEDPAAARLASQLSTNVRSLSVLADAVEAAVAWETYSADLIISDVRVLASLKGRLEELDPPLVRAVMRGHETAALAMIKTTADLEAQTIGRLNAMTAAAEAGSADLIKALLAAGALAQPKHGFPLHSAARAGRAEIAEALLDAGAPVDIRDGRGNTALIEAAGEGHQEVVALLLSRGADPEARGSEQSTALERAESEGFTLVAAALRARSAKS